MRVYTVKLGECINDICLNSTGSVSSLDSILQLNNFTDWNPILTEGTVLGVPEIIENNYYNELQAYPSCNLINFNQTQITDLNNTLSAISIFQEFALPDAAQVLYDTYTVKEGECIVDVSLNSTGTYLNVDTILTINNFTDWNPILTVGESLKISYHEKQNNVLKGLKEYPASNNLEINDFNEQVQDLINNFVSNAWILADGTWRDSGIWIDQANWID